MTTTLEPLVVPARGGGQEPRDAHASPRGRGAVGSWVVFALVILGRTYRAFGLTLLTVALLPTAIGWTGYVVRTGSMEPSISPGDVVVGRPFTREEKVPVGRVMVFRAPDGSGEGSTLRVHRVIAKAAHGGYTTQGDANATEDAAPAPRESFRARAVILVRWVGLPPTWLAHGQYLQLALWLAVSALLIGFSFRRLESDRPPRRRRNGDGPDTTPKRRTPVRPTFRRKTRARLDPRIGLGLVVTALVLVLPQSADAAFTGRTSSGSNTWKAAANLEQRYTTAVVTDAPWAFYRLDEASGTTAYDDSGSNRTGSYTSVAAYRETGALPNNPGYAARLAANSGRMVAGGSALSDPTTFSVELWFRTTSTAGGKLIGFENSRNQISTLYDREAVLRTDGRVAYVGGASTSKVLVSPAALNDGKWHHLVVTSVTAVGSNQASAMYVDGSTVASGTTSKASLAYTGWWRVGYGQIPIGTSFPLTGNLTATLDDVAVYTTQLSATRVAAHYAAR